MAMSLCRIEGSRAPCLSSAPVSGRSISGINHSSPLKHSRHSAYIINLKEKGERRRLHPIPSFRACARQHLVMGFSRRQSHHFLATCIPSHALPQPAPYETCLFGVPAKSTNFPAKENMLPVLTEEDKKGQFCREITSKLPFPSQYTFSLVFAMRVFY